jgi:hypothetical protein
MPTDPNADPRPDRGGAYDYRGRFSVVYAPEIDHEPDPGEIVWTWVPYEEDPTQGKDRPVVVLGFAVDAGSDYAVLMVSSRDRSRDRGWVGIGAGGWDRENRPSFVRLNRLLAVPARAVRREGAVMTKAQFGIVVDGLRELYR